MIEKARLMDQSKDYAALGISKEPHFSEDGMRTDGKRQSYEWWYNDAEFDNGVKLVCIFYTKKHFDVAGPAYPLVDLEITYPTGESYSFSSFEGKGIVLNAKKETCDVRINDSYLRYENGAYHLHFEAEGIVYDAIQESTLPMWRPNTGRWSYGDQDEHYFAWFVAQPSCTVKATLTLNGVTTNLRGTGYHDHNWGNISMDKLMNHWYWGRAQVGDYTIIACDIIAEKKYNFKRFPVFLLAKDGEIISDNQSITKIQRRETIQHPQTKKFMDNHLIYHQDIAENEAFEIEFMREGDILCENLLNLVSPVKKGLAKMIGMNPTYIRSVGKVRVSQIKDGAKNVIESEGIWEQMFFGKNQHATINE